MIILASIAVPMLMLMGVIVLWLMTRKQLLSCQLELHSLQQQLTQLQQNLQRLQQADVTISKRFAVIEQQFNHIEHRQDSLEDNQSIDTAYQQAVKMANQGASLEEIVKICQLTKPEAELILNLHGTHEIV